MKILITADIHIGNTSDSYIEENGLERSINETFKQLHFMLDYAIKKKIKYIFINGDVFDERNPIAKYNEMFNEWLKETFKNGIIVIIDGGNHDANNSGVSAVAPIKNMNFSNVHVYDDDVEVVDINDTNYILVPHLTKSQLGIKDINDYESQAKQIIKEKISKLIDSKKNNVIMGHLHAVGAVTGSEQRKLKGGINFFPDINNKYIVKIFLGHIHKYQKIVTKGVDTYYSGSPVRCSFTEKDEDKGFLIFDDESLQVDFIKLKTTEYKEVIINLVKKDFVELNDNKIKKVVSGKIVKLVIKISEKNRKRLNINEITSAFSKHCYIAKIVKEIVHDEKEEVEVSSYNPIEFFLSYIKSNIKDKKQLEFIKQKGKEIIEQAVSE